MRSSTNEKLDRDNYINGVSDMIYRKREIAEKSQSCPDEAAWNVFVGGFDSESLKVPTQSCRRSPVGCKENCVQVNSMQRVHRAIITFRFPYIAWTTSLGSQLETWVVDQGKNTRFVERLGGISLNPQGVPETVGTVHA